MMDGGRLSASRHVQVPAILQADIVVGEEELYVLERRLAHVGHDQQHEQVAEDAEDGVEPERARQVHGVLHVAERRRDDQRRAPEEGGDDRRRHAAVVSRQQLAQHQPRQRTQAQREGSRVQDHARHQHPLETFIDCIRSIHQHPIASE